MVARERVIKFLKISAKNIRAKDEFLKGAGPLAGVWGLTTPVHQKMERKKR